MFFEFSRLLQEAQRLIVVGYSFSDNHVDSAIKQWLSRSPDAQVLIVNPSAESWLANPRGRAPELVRALLGAYSAAKPGGGIELDSRLGFISETAAESLAELLGDGPRLNDSSAPRYE